MTSLLDIGDQSRVIPIQGVPVTLTGVTPEGFFFLMNRFPLLQNLFTRGRTSLSMKDLEEQAPGAVAYAIAVAATDRGKFVAKSSDDDAAFAASQREAAQAWKDQLDKVAAKVRTLATPHQMVLFDAVLNLTFPDGIGPFMQAMDSLATSINKLTGQNDGNTTDPGTTSSNPLPTGFVTDSPGRKLGKGAPLKGSRH